MQSPNCADWHSKHLRVLISGCPPPALIIWSTCPDSDPALTNSHPPVAESPGPNENFTLLDLDPNELPPLALESSLSDALEQIV